MYACKLQLIYTMLDFLPEDLQNVLYNTSLVDNLVPCLNLKLLLCCTLCDQLLVTYSSWPEVLHQAELFQAGKLATATHDPERVKETDKSSLESLR